jgi:curli biogenesis system outer membrane secretion channel CsgG
MDRLVLAAVAAAAIALPAAAQETPKATLSVEYYDGVITQLNRAAAAIFAENLALRAEVKRLQAANKDAQGDGKPASPAPTPPAP